MAGYLNDYSMSNNASAAYDAGLAPASKIPGVSARLVREFCSPSEWHHSSKFYNRVDFYDVAHVRATFGLEMNEDFEPNPAAVAALKARASAATKQQYENCRVRWLEWGGTRRHPTAKKREAENCGVVVKNQTATITRPDGITFTKRLGTRGFDFFPAQVGV